MNTQGVLRSHSNGSEKHETYVKLKDFFPVKLNKGVSSSSIHFMKLPIFLYVFLKTGEYFKIEGSNYRLLSCHNALHISENQYNSCSDLKAIKFNIKVNIAFHLIKIIEQVTFS